MRRLGWHRFWFALFVFSAVLLGLGLFAYDFLPAHVPPTVGQIMSAHYHPSAVVAVFVFGDWVVFWSGIISAFLEFGYQRRKRAGEMLRHYLRGEDVRAGYGVGPSGL